MSLAGRSSLCSILVAIVAATAAPQAEAASAPIWTLMVPAPATASTSSALQSITSDVVGNALVVISLTNTTMVGGAPFTFPAGTQVFLLNRRGQITGSVELPSSFSVTPLMVSARKVIAITGNGLVSLIPDQSGVLQSVSLTTQTPGEALIPSSPANFNFKYLHTAGSAGGFITTVKRYLVRKLTP
jgi:hypothetical protein